MRVEQWRPVVGYEGIYSVSNMGRVRREKPASGANPGHILAPATGPKGYLKVVLRKHHRGKCFLVHHLVAAAFCCPRPPGCEIRHLDGNPANNTPVNLLWGVSHENTQDREMHGRTMRGSKHVSAKLTESDVEKIRALRGVKTQREIGEEFGVHRNTIDSVFRGRTWKHVPARKESNPCVSRDSSA